MDMNLQDFQHPRTQGRTREHFWQIRPGQAW